MSDYGHNAEVSGSLTVTGSSTFNEESKDVDFRVESDGNANMLVVDAGNNRVGVGTNSPDTVLHVEGAAGDLFKLENTTAYGVTYGQLVATGVTLGAAPSPIDTGLNLPGNSIVDTVLIKITTLGGVSSGATFNITNVTLSGSAPLTAQTMFSASLSNLGLISALNAQSGTMYYLNNVQPNYPVGGYGTLVNELFPSTTQDIKIDYSSANVSSAAVVDVAVHYRTFESVR